MIAQAMPFPNAGLASLFAEEDFGDYWRFDAANTDAAVDEDLITAATGKVSGRILEDVGTLTAPKLDVPSGIEAAVFGADRLIYDFGSTIAQPITIIVSVQDTADTSNAVVVGGFSSALRCQISIDSSGNIIMFAGSTKDTGQNAPINGPKVFTGFFNGASSYFRVNGTQVATGTAGTQGTSRLTIGTAHDGTFGIQGWIYSVLFINRELTSGELDTAERQLGSDAGISWA